MKKILTLNLKSLTVETAPYLIIDGADCIRLGNTRTFIPKLFDDDGNPIDVDDKNCAWIYPSITGVEITQENQQISIKASINPSLMGTKILVAVSVENYAASKLIEIG